MIISIVIVAYNESKYLPNILKDIQNQTYNHNNIEIILIDSESTDNTMEIFKAFKDSSDFKKIQILKNKEKYLPQGCNIALDKYTGDLFLRVDAHATIPSDFIEKNIKTIQSGEDICGGPRPNIIENEDQLSKLLLGVETAMFGSGFADYRNGSKSKYVKSIFHGCYKREVFEKVGPYNENLLRTEDNEMSYRIRKYGYKIYYDKEIISYQYTRPTLTTMIRQKYLNGFWIGKTAKIDAKIFSKFHFVPLIFVLSIIISLLLCFLGIFIPILFIISIYAIFLFLSTILLFRDQKNIIVIIAPLILMLLHCSYGIGTLVGLFSKNGEKV